MNTRVSIVSTVLAAVWCGACEPAARVALPSPFPLTYGGTPIPANGIGTGLEFGDALRGQERERAEVLTALLAGGIDDRASASFAGYSGRENGDHSGQIWRLKLRLGDLFGRRSSTSLHFAYATMKRSSDTLQNDRLRTADVALPTEFLLTDPAEPNKASLVIGPRLTYEQYTDFLDQRQSKPALYPGLLGGLHFNVWIVHLYAEATLLHVPKDLFRGQPYGGRVTVMPSIGAVLQIGPSYSWGGKAKTSAAVARR
jgi:hypothetical protein